jgi:hypothetical protein
MKELIFTIIGSSAFAIAFAEIAGIPNAVKVWLFKRNLWVEEKINEYRRPRRLKPFDCAPCLSLWVCLALCYFGLHLPIIDCILTACLSCLFTVWAMKQTKP